MGNWSLGSVSTEVSTILENIPSNLSGAPIERIAWRVVNDMERYTGQAIGSVGIPDKYQPALLDLTISEVAQLMMATGMDAQSVTLGEFTVNKGGDSNLQLIHNNFKESGKEKLSNLGKDISSYQTFY